MHSFVWIDHRYALVALAVSCVWRRTVAAAAMVVAMAAWTARIGGLRDTTGRCSSFGRGLRKGFWEA